MLRKGISFVRLSTERLAAGQSHHAWVHEAASRSNLEKKVLLEYAKLLHYYDTGDKVVTELRVSTRFTAAA